MKQLNIGTNGFGRTGRTFFRLLADYPHLQVVAINDLADSNTLAHLLKYDSIHGISRSKIVAEGDCLTVDGNKIATLNHRSPEEIPWHKYHVDIVLEATGRFKTRKVLEHHITNGAKK